VQTEFCGQILLHAEGTRPRSEGGRDTSRPRSEGGQETSSIPVEPNRGATLPVTARPPRYPDARTHKYECWYTLIISGNETSQHSVTVQKYVVYLISTVSQSDFKYSTALHFFRTLVTTLLLFVDVCIFVTGFAVIVLNIAN